MLHCMRPCSIPECPRPLVARGWCHTHYEMWRRKGDPLAAKVFADNSGPCVKDGCDKPARSRGLCDQHYGRLRKHGDSDKILVRRGWTPEQRFEADIDRSGPTSCWIWRGLIDSHGYGMLYMAYRKYVRVHRYAYERYVKSIPPGHDLDHLCRVTACANPAHLQPVTHAENCLRGIGIHAQNARKTHCKQGHAFTPENTIITRQGSRSCRNCRNRWAAEARARRRR